MRELYRVPETMQPRRREDLATGRSLRGQRAEPVGKLAELLGQRLDLVARPDRIDPMDRVFSGVARSSR